MIGPRPATRTTRSAVAFAIASLLWAVFASQPTMAAELVMVESRSCVWCLQWHREIGPAYSKTPQGQRAPLQRVDISDVSRVSRAFTSPVTMTPTFVLIEQGREIGRIVGNPGGNFFWGLLDDLLDKLDALYPGPCDTAPCNRRDNTRHTALKPEGRS